MIRNNTNKFDDKTNEDYKRIDLFSDRLRNFVDYKIINNFL